MLNPEISIAELRTNPTLPLPPYRYVPGRSPHPFRHKDGHNNSEQTLELLAEHPEQEQRIFLYGLELMNAYFFWEAHEILEFLWLRSEGEQKELLQGLIKSAASLLKLHMNHIGASQNLWNSAAQLLDKKTIPNIDLEYFKNTITAAHEQQSLDSCLSFFKELS